MSGPTTRARLGSKRQEAEAEGRRARVDERTAGTPPCPLTPPGMPAWKADHWLAGYTAEFRERG